MPRSAPSATFFGRNSTHSISRMSTQAGRPLEHFNRRPAIKEPAVMTPDLNSVPSLAPGCRLNEKNQQPRVLHMPERALRLNGPSLEIVERCDGSHTVQQIISELQNLYSKAEPQRIERDILDYFALLYDKRAVDFVSHSIHGKSEEAT